jgi:hypothetical protein
MPLLEKVQPLTVLTPEVDWLAMVFGMIVSKAV